MYRPIIILAGVLALAALPLILRRMPVGEPSAPGECVVVVISPHNQAVTDEFGAAFTAWHQRLYGRPARVDWRNVGGTAEIMRFLASEYAAARQGTARPGSVRGAIDVFFGGGTHDHARAAAEGWLEAPWSEDRIPSGVFTDAQGRELIPEQLGGEVWRTPLFFAATLGTFGICYNTDRLGALGVKAIPARWEDLTDPRLFRAVGLADPTKSGSMTKAFEMIIQEQCRQAVHTAGFSDTQIDAFEDKIQRAGLSPGWLPDGVPPEYQVAVENGFFNGLNILRRMGANARYFTDAAQRVPMDAAAGAIAAGVSIDYYARIEAQVACEGQGGRAFTGFNMPMGGASAGGDPIALLCGAPHRETAVRFIEFVLGEEGQKLWCFRPGTPGGPRRTALYRPPVRRDFYPGWSGSRYEEFEPFLSYPLKDPSWNMYAVAQAFVYRPRWTAAHFDILRDLVRAMCIDSSESLQAAWREMIRRGGPAACPQAMALFEQWPGVPLPIRWANLLEMKKAYDRRELLRIWTRAFRENYVRAREACL